MNEPRVIIAPRIIPEDVLRVQIEASDPAVSAFVAANAGSGKTHVLAQRVIRLLLDGVEPAKILCITFTKAAAAIMANRVFDTLRHWTRLDDAALDREIHKVGCTSITRGLRARARQLFARVLETPGGLKVQTIHAFCTRLLHQFPFEANVAARFTVLDDSAQAQLLDQLVLGVLLKAAADRDSALGRALAIAVAGVADQTLKDVLNEAIGERDALTKWIEHAGGVDTAITQLSHTLGVDPKDTAEAVEAEFFSGTIVRPEEWPEIVAILARGSESDRKQGAWLAAAQALVGSERLEAYLAIFCTTTDRTARKTIITRSVAANHPELLERLQKEQKRVCALLERRHAIFCRDRSAALMTLADAVIARYRTEKENRSLLDYDDLIDHTLALFRNVSAAWVLYKLDLGIDHVLVDEAQDTSPKQWDVINHVVGEFFAGVGARGALQRTVFAVGDEKQSIFSFQGAIPFKFAEMRRHFRTLHEGREQAFIFREFKHSFRSGENVLAAVDAVFRDRAVAASVSSDTGGVPPHFALPDAAPGVVELWPIIKAEAKPEIEGWDAPFDEIRESSPPAQLARRIARTINVWRRAGTRPGDILVLVRQRGAVFEAVIRALKEANIAVAGADRLMLTEHIAVMDLMVLADALLLPQDDLALATVLRSPLFGLSEDELFALAHGRKGSLRDTLAAKASEDARFAEAAERLDRFAVAARRSTPFSFYAHLLGAEGGRTRMLARLGPEASDALDEFLNLALDYERRETPSLHGFVAWLRAARAEVKRDMEIVRDEVRVMTVHGAKGLEAPIVILADTTTPPAGPRPPRLLPVPAAQAPPGTPDRIVWIGRKETDVAPVRAARDQARSAAEDEYRRLLYVAMTRAAERLIVCGTEGERSRPKGCWYDLVADALSPHMVEEPADDGEGTVKRFRKSPHAAKLAPVRTPEAQQSMFFLPAWLTRDAPKDAPKAAAITPSDALEDDGGPAPFPFVPTKDDGRVQALARGRIVHRLMQSLPDIAPARRAEALQRHLARAGDIDAAERDAIAAQVLSVLDDPRFAPLFVGSRAEVPIVGRIARPGLPPLAVSGQIDRLAVTPEAVLIADYKTNRPAPRRIEDVPPSYVAQLALYRAVLRTLYPDRLVRAALLWTDVPEFMEIPSDAMDQALARVTSP